jgi:NAD(P)-dependent dehydrogenase (short-subunit alcohol dehydrogenase family)
VGLEGTPFDLTGRVAVVTGGSRGLGRAMAQAFAAAGADIVIASRHEQACVEAAREIAGQTGREVMAYGLHVGQWDDLEPFVDAVCQRFGHIDVLVNNAGISPLYDNVGTVSEALLDKVLAVNLKGPFRLTALAGQRMAAGHGGSIINISSAAAVHPRPHNLPYAAAKAALNALTAGFARAFGPAVRCNAIMAGTFITDVSKAWDMNAFAERAKGFALGRGGEPREIVGTALYLASDASSYTTGSVITVDGGQP